MKIVGNWPNFIVHNYSSIRFYCKRLLGTHFHLSMIDNTHGNINLLS